MNYTDGSIAKKIVDLQNDDGTWGKTFHSLAQPNKRYPLTTEQALRRLKILGFTINDTPIRKAVDCMTLCLRGERKIDDYWEKSHNWELFTQLILSTWVRIFDPNNEIALNFSKRWSNIIDKAFESGAYNNEAYLEAYTCEFSSKPKGSRELDFSDFYHIHLLQGVLSEKTENQLLDYIIAKPNGIYYVYNKPINTLPNIFASKETSWYLSAIEILSGYKLAKEKLSFVVNWLENNKDKNGQWDLGKKTNDNVNFPLSDSWKNDNDRKADCTEKLAIIIQNLKR
jgi:hypothetical protein